MTYEKRSAVDELPAHVQRVVDERDELVERLGKLETFILTNTFFKTLPADEQLDMRQQHGAMALYRDILISRLCRAGA